VYLAFASAKIAPSVATHFANAAMYLVYALMIFPNAVT
jgi:hypothetical protein